MSGVLGLLQLFVLSVTLIAAALAVLTPVELDHTLRSGTVELRLTGGCGVALRGEGYSD